MGRYQCSGCGVTAARWVGRCPGCGAWSTLAEGGSRPQPVPIGQVASGDLAARPTGLAEVDRVLGGGLVPGSVTLLAGEPGVGKSTLVLQLAARLAAGGRRCLLVTAEESAAQGRLRSEEHTSELQSRQYLVCRLLL